MTKTLDDGNYRTIIKRYVGWAFWKLRYLFRNPWRRESLDQFLIRTQRTWAPWWKFKPYVHHNPDWQAWEVYFSDEPDYVEPRTIEVNAHVSQTTGRIVGFKVFEKDLVP